MSQLFKWGGQNIRVSALASVLPMNTQDWSPIKNPRIPQIYWVKINIIMRKNRPTDNLSRPTYTSPSNLTEQINKTSVKILKMCTTLVMILGLKNICRTSYSMVVRCTVFSSTCGIFMILSWPWRCYKCQWTKKTKFLTPVQLSKKWK